MLNHKGTVQLETERLLLRRFTMEDAEAMYRGWASDEEVYRYLRAKPHKSVEDTKAVIGRWIENYEELQFYRWLIVLKESVEPVGVINLHTVHDGDQLGEISYCLSRRHWGKGMITEAGRAMLEFAFYEVGFNRIEAFHAIANPASGSVMQKLGMRFEGMARQKFKSASGFQDCHMYAVLKEDFEA